MFAACIAYVCVLGVRVCVRVAYFVVLPVFNFRFKTILWSALKFSSRLQHVALKLQTSHTPREHTHTHTQMRVDISVSQAYQWLNGEHNIFNEWISKWIYTYALLYSHTHTHTSLMHDKIHGCICAFMFVCQLKSFCCFCIATIENCLSKLWHKFSENNGKISLHCI